MSGPVTSLILQQIPLSWIAFGSAWFGTRLTRSDCLAGPSKALADAWIATRA